MISAPSAAEDACDARFEPAMHSVCRCGRAVSFRSTGCGGCGAPLGYAPAAGRVVALRRHERVADAWRAIDADGAGGAAYRRCSNFDSPAHCNWLVDLADAEASDVPCAACGFNRTIPDLSQPGNGALWARMETAKCGLVAQLLALGLPLPSWNDGPAGLAFDFRRAVDPTAPVVTGHERGVITIDLDEADDAKREAIRKAMGEPYRTLVGHFRHESGHFYWALLVDGTPRHDGFRDLFGDDGRDYDTALDAYYRSGPPAHWRDRFISAYASTHPWEDWAETWAHYLHMSDAVATAARMGYAWTRVERRPPQFDRSALWRLDGDGGDAFLDLLNGWLRLTAVMNEMSRSVGQADFYPFVLSRTAVEKLHFVHCLISDSSQRLS